MSAGNCARISSVESIWFDRCKPVLIKVGARIAGLGALDATRNSGKILAGIFHFKNSFRAAFGGTPLAQPKGSSFERSETSACDA